MKVLVTGGAGFIGSNFSRLLVEQLANVDLTIIDKLTYAGGLDSLDFIKNKKNIRFIQGDVIDSSLIDFYVKDITHVIHFAAETHVTRSLFDSREFILTDVLGTQNLLSSLVRNRKNLKRFIHISSSEVYGTALSSEITEVHPLNPLSPYAAAKCGADRLVYSFLRAYSLPGFIIRPFNNYGPYQHLEKVIPRFITSALRNLPLVVHGDGSSERDWIYVEDTCKALIELLFNPDLVLETETINLGTGISTSILDIAHSILLNIPNTKSEIIFTKDRPAQVLRHTSSQDLAKSIISSFNPINLTEGIQKTINWYSQNESWWLKRWDAREIKITLEDGSEVLH